MVDGGDCRGKEAAGMIGAVDRLGWIFVGSIAVGAAGGLLLATDDAEEGLMLLRIQ